MADISWPKSDATDQCGYVTWVGAYLLIALSPAERELFTMHLRTCEHCRNETIALAEMPGLLSRIRGLGGQSVGS